MLRKSITFLLVSSLTLSSCANQIAAVKDTKFCPRLGFLQYSSCISSELDKAAKNEPSEHAKTLKLHICNLRRRVTSKIITEKHAYKELDNKISELFGKEKEDDGKRIALGILVAVAIAGAAFAASKSGDKDSKIRSEDDSYTPSYTSKSGDKDFKSRGEDDSYTPSYTVSCN
jgi:hypothetical protein